MGTPDGPGMSADSSGGGGDDIILRNHHARPPGDWKRPEATVASRIRKAQAWRVMGWYKGVKEWRRSSSADMAEVIRIETGEEYEVESFRGF